MIKFVIEIVIAFVIQALDQINLTIASTSESDPLSLCIYMHRSHASADINIYTLYQHPDPLFGTSPLYQHPDPLDILSKDSKRRREPGALPTRFVGVNALALQDGALTGGELGR